MTENIENFAEAVLQAVRREMFGVDEIIRLSLVAFYTGGHVLLEGNPGFGKTELVKTLGKVLQLPFGRIQFTPDLMPADITGTFMPDLSNGDFQKLVFQPGPIFTSLLLADEINRATPKTQSAMLEAMAEQQVTVLGQKRELDTPFMVLATQNPIDHEGTYNLPEAQADRFMFKITMPVPNADTLRLIVRKQAGTIADETNSKNSHTSVGENLLPRDKDDSKKKYKELCEQIFEKVKPLLALEVHILNMFLASNRRFDELKDIDVSDRRSVPPKLKDLDGKQVKRVKLLVNELLTYGLGPRAAIALMLGAKAWSLMFSPRVEKADGPALARVVIPTLRHRIKLDFDWEDRYRRIIKQDNRNEPVSLERMLKDFCTSTAPEADSYDLTVAEELDKVIRERGW